MQFFTADFFHDLHHLIVKISTYQQCIFLFKINPDAINFDLLDVSDILEHLILLHPRQFQAELAFNFFHFYPTDL